jgi:hypothetical protein
MGSTEAKPSYTIDENDSRLIQLYLVCKITRMMLNVFQDQANGAQRTQTKVHATSSNTAERELQMLQ